MRRGRRTTTGFDLHKDRAFWELKVERNLCFKVKLLNLNALPKLFNPERLKRFWN